MKAKELMFGDIVDFDGWNYRLTGVEKCDVRVADGLLGLDEIKPVQLTTELLEKNGFVKAECKLEWEFEDNDQQAGNRNRSRGERVQRPP